MTAVLGAVIVVLLLERVVLVRQHTRERGRLTNAVIAKNGGELLALNREPRKAVEPSPARRLASQLDNPLGF